jgi:hypothetical protein
MNAAFNMRIKFLALLFIASCIIISCKKNEDAKLPTISFKTGGNYTSSDASVTTSDLINVGIKADRNQADLKTYKVYSSVGVADFSLRKTFYLTPDEKDSYENDFEIYPAAKNTYETWKFEITDASGNSNSVSLKLTIH